MPNEIYHRSEWGNPKAEGFGDVYFDAAATNKLYNHSDNYENSDGTDKILRDIPNKASIVLTPTAYSDGSLNTVIPPYQVLPTELVTNGTFDTDTDWTKDSGWSISGGLATRTNTGSYGALYQNCLTNGKKYKVTITISSITSQGFFGVRLGTNYILQGITEAGTYTATGTSTSTTLSVMGNPTFAGSIDNISIKEVQEADFDFSRGSSATRVNEKGLIEDVASGIPRIDYTSGQGALLLEPQSTNLITYSEDLTTRWTTSASTITADTQISPDGSQTADTITVTGNSGGVYSDNITVIASTSYTFSFYVKRGTISDSETALAVRNQTAGTFINTDTSYSANADNWTRIEHTFTTPVGCTSVRLYPQRLSSGGQGTIFVWGCQLEAGNYATSYIPTEGSSVTRSADVANNSGNADLFNDSEGVLYAEIAALFNDSTNRKIAIGTSSNRIIFGYKNASNQIRVEVISSGSAVFDNTQTIDDITTFSKFAIKYKQNDFSLWMNGEEVATDTSGNVPIGLSELAFDDGGGNNFYGKTKELAVFKEALTDEELQALTT